MHSSLKSELLKAKQKNYAVPAFNFDNLEMLKAIIEKSEELASPVILMVTEAAAKYMGIDYAMAIGVTAVAKAKVPVIFHWDHGYDLELIKNAIDLKISSVMIDASLLPFAENVKLTQAVVEYAKKNNVDVEAEIGHVGGKEDDTNAQQACYTDINDVQQFLKQVDVNTLAIAVGTAHGIYRGEPKLNIKLIKTISDKTNIPLVLHGSSGVPKAQITDAIKAGICKVNFGTDLKIAYTNALRTFLNNNELVYDARRFGRYAIDQLKKVVEEKILMVNSQNKAG